MLDLAAGRCRAGLEAGSHPRLERLEGGDARGAHHPLGDGAGGHDVRLLPRLEEHAVDALVGQGVLPEGRDVQVAEHRGVEGVATEVGEGGRVGGLPRVGGDELLDGDHLHAGEVVAGRVDHQRGVDAVEGTLAGHQDLAAATLLGGRAEHHHSSTRLGCHRGRGQAGAETGGGDDVVPARVAEAGQGVVLEQHGDGGARLAGPRRERRVDAVRRPLDRQALVLQHPREEVVREVLLVVRLRVLVDLMGELDEPVGPGLDLSPQAVLQRGHIHGAHPTGGSGPPCPAGRLPRAVPARWGTTRGRTSCRPRSAGPARRAG